MKIIVMMVQLMKEEMALYLSNSLNISFWDKMMLEIVYNVWNLTLLVELWVNYQYLEPLFCMDVLS